MGVVLYLGQRLGVDTGGLAVTGVGCAVSGSGKPSQPMNDAPGITYSSDPAVDKAVGPDKKAGRRGLEVHAANAG